MGGLGKPASCSGDASLLSMMMLSGSIRPFFERRSQRQANTRRITARISNDFNPFQRIGAVPDAVGRHAVQLGSL